VNLYSVERLKDQLSTHFRTCFIFCANDEIVHTGFFPLAHYLIVISTNRRWIWFLFL